MKGVTKGRWGREDTDATCHQGRHENVRAGKRLEGVRDVLSCVAAVGYDEDWHGRPCRDVSRIEGVADLPRGIPAEGSCEVLPGSNGSQDMGRSGEV